MVNERLYRSLESRCSIMESEVCRQRSPMVLPSCQSQPDFCVSDVTAPVLSLGKMVEGIEFFSESKGCWMSKDALNPEATFIGIEQVGRTFEVHEAKVRPKRDLVAPSLIDEGLLEEESRAPRLLPEPRGPSDDEGDAMKPLTCLMRLGARFVWRAVALMPGIRLQYSRRVQNCRHRPTTCSSLGIWILPSSNAVSRRCQFLWRHATSRLRKSSH